MSKKPWDLTSTNSLAAACGWIRERAGARLVLVIRDKGIGISVEPGMAPMDVIQRIRNELPELLDHLIKEYGRAQGKREPVNLDAEEP